MRMREELGGEKKKMMKMKMKMKMKMMLRNKASIEAVSKAEGA